MNEYINLVDILKDAPKGTKLWSPIFGECSLVTICSTNATYPIAVDFDDESNYKTTRFFTAFGKFTNIDGAECVLLPSKEHRDWSTFKAPWKHKHFEPFQKVLIPGIINNVYYWSVNLYSYYNKKYKVHVLVDGQTVYNDKHIIPYEGNEDKLGKQIECMA